jgi:hypothetical protein
MPSNATACSTSAASAKAPSAAIACQTNRLRSQPTRLTKFLLDAKSTPRLIAGLQQGVLQVGP